MFYCGVQGVLLGLGHKKIDSIIMWSSFGRAPLLILIGALIYPLFKPGLSNFVLIETRV